jgi:hypothetical protein
MVTALRIETLAQNNATIPQTRLKVVRGSKSDNIPISPFGPATALKDKKFNVFHWQLQFDFSKPVQAATRPRKQSRARTAKPSVQPVDQSGKKLNRLQKLKALAGVETGAQQEARLAKGAIDRTAFLQWIERGIDHMTKEPIYKRFSKIARSETLRALNKTRTLRGISAEEAEQIWMDHYHNTIIKVADALGDGVHEFEGGIHRFDDYFFSFLVPDAKRYVRYLDQANVQHYHIYADSEDDDKGDIWGLLGKMLSEVPTFLEGRVEEFKEYCYYEIFRMAENDYVQDNDPQQWRDVLFFTTYYSTRQTLGQVSQELGFSVHAISKGRDKVKAFVQENMSLASLQTAFGKKIMEGCNCG